MDIQKRSIEELEISIADLQKKILIGNENLREDNLSHEETLRLKEAILNLNNQVFQCQTSLSKKYKEANKEVSKDQL